MPSAKRAAPAASSPSTKRAKPSKPANTQDAVAAAGEAVVAELSAFAATAQQHVLLELAGVRELLAYVKQLQAAGAPNEMTPEQLTEQVAMLRSVIGRGIEKQMKWKPSCKWGAGLFSFEGICGDSSIMAGLLGVADGTQLKGKRYTSKEFQNTIVRSDVTSSVRYDTLVLTSNVSLKWNAETGEHKWTGKYGKPGTGKNALPPKPTKATKKTAVPDDNDEEDEDDEEDDEEDEEDDEDDEEDDEDNEDKDK